MRRDDRGWVAASTAILAFAFVLIAGLVIDGGRRLTALMRASDLAGNASRAAAQETDTATLYGGGGPVINQDAALASALAFLDDAGYPGAFESIDFPAPNEVTVRVHLDHASLILDWADTTVHAQATSTAVQGVDQ